MDRFELGVTAVLAIFLALGIFEWYDDRTSEVPEGQTEGTRASPSLPLLILGIFIGGSGLLALKTSMDHFNQGALVLIVILEFFAYVGWLGATERLLKDFLIITAAMLIMTATVVVAHVMQRQK